MKLKVIASELVPVYENQSGDKLINSRELHQKLMISTRHNDWINRMIDKYGFIQGEDFYSNLSKTNGRPSLEHFLTIDTAKEISMVQNNEIGRAIRKYFIRVEKEARNHFNQPQSSAELILQQAQLLVQYEKRMDEIEIQQQDIRHRIDNFDRIDTIGDPQQRLNKMIKKYAWDNGIRIDVAWKRFDQAYNTAFRTNITQKRNNYANKHGFKSLTRPQYLSLTNQIHDAIRVADKMINQKEALA